MGDKGRQDPWEGGDTIQQRETRRGTMGDKGRQDPREGGHTIQQRETRRGTIGDKGRQDPREGEHTIQHQGGHLKKAFYEEPVTRHCNWGAIGDKGRQDLEKAGTPSNRYTCGEAQWETMGNMARQRERQGETRPWEGGRTIQHRHTCGKTMGEKLGDKERQGLGKADTHFSTGTWGDKGRQDHREGGGTIQWEPKGDKT